MLVTRDMMDFIRILNRYKVEYVLVGGFAVIYYGYVRTTQDIDFLVLPSRENALKLIGALEAFGFGGVGFSKELFEKEGTAVHLGVEPNRIDILTTLKGVSVRGVFSRVKRVRYRGIMLNVISFEDLIKCKKHSTRLKDLADAEALRKPGKKKKRR